MQATTGRSNSRQDTAKLKLREGFVHGNLSNGRNYKMLTVLDQFTRQALAVTVRATTGASKVLEALY
ncbi:MAG: hypothetical protein AAGH43_07195 [Pseudomonadota bacterium]